MKEYADERRNTRSSHIRVGDTVMVKNDQKKKFDPPYHRAPHKVTEVKGSMIRAQTDQRSITRNSSQMKKIADREEEDWDITTHNAQHDAVEEEGEDPEEEQPAARRYPQRDRRAPNHLQDFVT